MSTNDDLDVQSLPGEIWRPIPGTDERYMVSNLGRARTHIKGKGRWTQRTQEPQRILPAAFPNGYADVRLYVDGQRRHCYVHRLVYEAFVAPIPPDMDINHRNGDKADNTLENLEVVSRSENIRHAYRVLGVSARRGEQHPNSKLTGNNVKAIRLLYDHGLYGTMQLAELFGVTQPNIMAILLRRSWDSVE